MNDLTHQKQIRVLIVDDHPLVREYLGRLINSFPRLDLCGEVGDSRQALPLIHRLQPRLVITELSMRHGSGFDLIKDINLHYPQIHILVLSMHERLDYAERAILAGASGYITKQESSLCILEAIERVVTGRLYLPHSLSLDLVDRLLLNRRPGLVPRIDRLSNRELDIFDRYGNGCSTRQIAEDLALEIKTIETHRLRMRKKLNLNDCQEMLDLASQWVEAGPRQSVPSAAANPPSADHVFTR